MKYLSDWISICSFFLCIFCLPLLFFLITTTLTMGSTGVFFFGIFLLFTSTAILYDKFLAIKYKKNEDDNSLTLTTENLLKLFVAFPFLFVTIFIVTFFALALLFPGEASPAIVVGFIGYGMITNAVILLPFYLSYIVIFYVYISLKVSRRFVFYVSLCVTFLSVFFSLTVPIVKQKITQRETERKEEEYRKQKEKIDNENEQLMVEIIQLLQSVTVSEIASSVDEKIRLFVEGHKNKIGNKSPLILYSRDVSSLMQKLQASNKSYFPVGNSSSTEKLKKKVEEIERVCQKSIRLYSYDFYSLSSNAGSGATVGAQLVLIALDDVIEAKRIRITGTSFNFIRDPLDLPVASCQNKIKINDLYDALPELY